MISLLALCPTAYDATSFYRGAGPLGRLKQTKGQIELLSSEPVDWPVMNQVDVCFMQRPFTKGHEEIAVLARKMRTPLWLDYDDDLFSLTADNPARKAYSGKEVHAQMKKMLSLASVVTVSTWALKRKFERFTKAQVLVVPNALDEKPLEEREERPQNPVILWRGSSTHQRDVISYAEEIHAANVDQRFKWYFLGYNPFFLTEHLDQGRLMVADPVPPEDLHHTLYAGVKPDIMIVPLADTEFNRSKSNCAWLEGTYAGAACLVPDWEEWQRPGAVLYKNPNDFKEKLLAMMNGEIDTRECARKSWEYIQANLTLSTVNETRWEILTGLAGHT